jgi:hypothetical protein
MFNKIVSVLLLMTFAFTNITSAASVVLNGRTYNTTDFTGYGYTKIFPTPLLSDMLTEMSHHKYTWRGAWNNSTGYVASDVVSYSNTVYICKVDSAAGILPTDTSKWDVMVTGGGSSSSGTTWYNGTTIPSNTLGVIGDYYLKADTGDIYNKAGGGWVAISNIVGPQGPQGPTGTGLTLVANAPSSSSTQAAAPTMVNQAIYLAMQGKPFSNNTSHNPITIKSDWSATIDPQQLTIRDSNNRRLELGYHTTNDYGAIQAADFNTSQAKPLVLNPGSAPVGVGVVSPVLPLEVMSPVDSAQITYGPNLITNTADSDFTSNTGHWTVSGTWTISGGRLNHNTGAAFDVQLPNSYLSALPEPGKTYRVQMVVSTTSTGTLGELDFNFGGSTVLLGDTVATGNNTFTFFMQATNNTDPVSFLPFDETWTGNIDNLIIQKVLTTSVGVIATKDNSGYTMQMSGDSSGTVRMGINAGQFNTGQSGTFVGNNAGRYANTTSGICVGADACKNASGDSITVVGSGALSGTYRGAGSSVFGNMAGANAYGRYLTLIGSDSGSSLNNSQNVIAIGISAGKGDGASDLSNGIFLGNRSGNSETNSNKIYISNISGKVFLKGDLKTGHTGSKGYSAPTISGCGTGATVQSGSNDTYGIINTGTSAGTCVITFATAYGNIPSCTISAESGAGVPFSKTISAITVTATSLSSTKLNYRCSAMNDGSGND